MADEARGGYSPGVARLADAFGGLAGFILGGLSYITYLFNCKLFLFLWAVYIDF